MFEIVVVLKENSHESIVVVPQSWRNGNETKYPCNNKELGRKIREELTPLDHWKTLTILKTLGTERE